MRTDFRSVLVDSNVLFDILQGDLQWAEWSAQALSRVEDGRVNPIIYAELCYQKTSPEDVDRILADLALGYDELPREALFLAAQAFRRYRTLGGARTFPLSDFFIGAHAVVLGIPLLTRDTRRYQTYFPGITLIAP